MALLEGLQSSATRSETRENQSRSDLWYRQPVQASGPPKGANISARCLAASESGRPLRSLLVSSSAAAFFVLQAESLLKPGARVWHCWLGLSVAGLRLQGRYHWLSLAQCFHVLAAFTSSSMKLTGQRLRS